MPVSMLPDRPIDTSWMKRCEGSCDSGRKGDPERPARLCKRCEGVLKGTTWRRYCPTCAPIVSAEKKAAREKQKYVKYKPTACVLCGGDKERRAGIKYCPTCKPLAKTAHRKTIRQGDYFRERYWKRKGIEPPPRRDYYKRVVIPQAAAMKRTGSTVSRMIPDRLPYQR